jgi:hypothetical protein
LLFINKKKKENIEIKEFKNKYAPYEFHFEDNKDKFNEQTLYLSKVKCRTFYTQLDDKAKLVYIKKCEAAFDKHKVIFYKVFTTMISLNLIKFLFK